MWSPEGETTVLGWPTVSLGVDSTQRWVVTVRSKMYSPSGEWREGWGLPKLWKALRNAVEIWQGQIAAGGTGSPCTCDRAGGVYLVFSTANAIISFLLGWEYLQEYLKRTETFSERPQIPSVLQCCRCLCSVHKPAKSFIFFPVFSRF